ncbi:hypothetical protein UFOVP772_12 [uncultured Caudovirales phage]|jgi:uncharacterized membrane protein|uniref:Uncharacterized protein n=1 Tax=uncultured Caudovirales phage TaxID=2100421 RepID=A0A6J5NUV1_9CAUD|nr:hypothetical protein UFOVP772_12 [uncultured Caudovirales phage]
MMDFILMLFFAGMMVAFLFVFVVIALYAVWATLSEDSSKNEPKKEEVVR